MEDNRPVKIASYLTVPQAELAQGHLAMHGISARVGNPAFLTWCWHLSNAVGGAKLYVSAGEVERARDILAAAREELPGASPPGQCVKCGELRDRRWEICWRCGTSVDGIEDPLFTQHDVHTGPRRRISEGEALGLLSLLTVGLFAISGGSLLVMLTWIGILTTYLLLELLPSRDADSPASDEPIPVEAEPVLDAAGQSRARRCRTGKALALRAWQASMIGILLFPPLAFYSIYLLERMRTRKWPLDLVSLCRYWAAWVVSIFVVLFFGTFLAALIYLMSVESRFDIFQAGHHLLDLLFPIWDL